MLDARALSDRALITDVLLSYGRGVDSGDTERVIACFTDDVHSEHGGVDVMDGIAEVREWVEQHRGKRLIPLDEIHQTMHLLSNTTIDLDGDEADTVTYCVSYVVGTRAGAPLMLVRGHHYVDHFVRVGEKWAIQHRVHRPRWQFEQIPV